MTEQWEVIVSNVGTVLMTTNEDDARGCYTTYVLTSKSPNGGSVRGESVTLMCDGTIADEYLP